MSYEERGEDGGSLLQNGEWLLWDHPKQNVDSRALSPFPKPKSVATVESTRSPPKELQELGFLMLS